uniref:Uncharacterized protein n=1 Tax=Molossus molossus TaxID=27622 RepID=A0A7J8C8P5_MOLMO|nr:hypothetical protein HJG59_009911 [Molossus molossus]
MHPLREKGRLPTRGTDRKASLTKRRSVQVFTEASDLNEPFCIFPQRSYVLTHEAPLTCWGKATSFNLSGGREHSHFPSGVAEQTPPAAQSNLLDRPASLLLCLATRLQLAHLHFGIGGSHLRGGESVVIRKEVLQKQLIATCVRGFFWSGSRHGYWWVEMP